MKHTIPAPVTPRDTLERFRFYQKERGLQSITRDIDFSNVTCAQVFASIVGHIPGYLTGVPDPDNFNPRWQTLQVLSALEFQDRIREIIPAAFPEKRRLIFIHNPKCAGTDMRVTLRRNYPLIEEYLAMPAMTAKPAFFEELRIIMTTMHSSDSIAMTGHVPIWWYLANNLIRPQDEIFTSVRNPIDRVYSHLNYVLTVVISSNGKRHDAADWLRQIGMTGIAPDTPAPPISWNSHAASCGRAVLCRRIRCANISAAIPPPPPLKPLSKPTSKSPTAPATPPGARPNSASSRASASMSANRCSPPIWPTSPIAVISQKT